MFPGEKTFSSDCLNCKEIRRPESVCLYTWNYQQLVCAEETTKRQQSFQRRGGVSNRVPSERRRRRQTHVVKVFSTRRYDPLAK